MELTRKQIAFCNEYLIDYNATQAALRAGYSKRAAPSQGSTLLHNQKVQVFLDKRRDQILKVTDVNTERVVRELANIAFSNVTDFISVGEKGTISLTDWGLLSKEQTACIESVCQTKEGYRLKLYSKPTALEQLGKYLSMFNQEPKGYEEPDPFKNLTKEQLDRACDGDSTVFSVPNSHVS